MTLLPEKTLQELYEQQLKVYEQQPNLYSRGLVNGVAASIAITNQEDPKWMPYDR